MADISNLSNYLKDVADAIREKKGTEGEIPAANFDTEIKSIETGIDTSDANATVNDIVLNKTAYVNGEKITGTLPLFPNSRTFTVDGGVTNDAENNRIQIRTINATKQILDSNLNMEFNGEYTDVANAISLIPEKLVKGNTILGVEGSAETGIDTSDATATVKDILAGKTAYVDGEKLEGTMANNGELNYNSSTEEQLIPAGYTSGGTIAPAPLTDTEYDECLELSEQILGENVSL